MPNNNQNPDKFILIIFGGSGDLSRRKLIPALYSLYQQGRLPYNFAILGLGRKELDDNSYRKMMTESLANFARNKERNEAGVKKFLSNLYYQRFYMDRREDYNDLTKRLEKLDNQHEISGNYLYYLATPPEFFGPVAENLGAVELNDDRVGWKRIILEKPIGHDLESAQELNRKVTNIFNEEQIYRIDHYLGKETVQNILAFRFANGIFEPLWNRRYIHHVEITAAEQIGVEDRGGYYDTSGALRDMIQNHLLQVAATIAMEPPSRFEAKAVRDEKVKVFHSIRPISPENISSHCIRGQYTASKINDQEVPGYRDEVNVPPESKTETYAAIKFYIDNWRWGGVPFYIRTGKRLPTRVTEVVIHYNKTPHHIFRSGSNNNSSENQLIIRIQPDEGIMLRIGMKVPGAGFDIKDVDMDFHYSDLTDTDIPEAYERLLLDALLGDGTLYARADSVEQAWRFIQPILDAWQNDPAQKLYGYPAGTWGPQEAERLFADPTEVWHSPCKSLTDDNAFCEL